MISTFFLFFHLQAHLFIVRTQLANAATRLCVDNSRIPRSACSVVCLYIRLASFQSMGFHYGRPLGHVMNEELERFHEQR
jgi:hypothetical protein